MTIPDAIVDARQQRQAQELMRRAVRLEKLAVFAFTRRQFGLIPLNDVCRRLVVTRQYARELIGEGHALEMFNAADFDLTERVKRPLPREVREAIHARDGYRCRQCGATERLSVDHIIAECRGGSSDPSNLQTLCITCNFKKGSGYVSHKNEVLA